MKKNFKVITLLVILSLCVSMLAGCGGGSKPASQPAQSSSAGDAKKVDFPTKPITLIVSYAAGGGTDVGARILQPYVEKELGTTINVVNKAGGGGWVGWTDLLKSKPDGYTIAYINTPNLMTGYLDPQYNRKDNLDSFAVISNHVVDYGAIAVNPKETRFKDGKELLEYAKKNELTATTTGVGSDDHISILKLNKELGTKFTPVHTKGAADGKAAIMGGHVDVWFANVGEVTVPEKNGEVKTLIVMAPERSKFLPDVPTTKELGAEVYSWSARGIAAPKGVDPAVLNVLVEAFDKALKNPEQVEKMAKMGLDVKPIKGEEYVKFLKEDEKGVIEVSDLLGFKK